MSSHKLQAIVDKWADRRKKTVISLRSRANELESSHRRNAKEEHGGATLSLTGGVIGLGIALLVPVSGGLSSLLFGFSFVLEIGSYVKNRQANQKDESVTNEVEAKFKSALDQDRAATAKVMELCRSFESLEEQMEKYNINVIIRDSVQKTSITNLNISKGNIHSSNMESDLTPSIIHVARSATQVANFVNLFADQTSKTIATKSKFSHVAETTVGFITTRNETTFSTVSKTTPLKQAATMRKIALALNAVLIPLEIYNLVVASENLGKSYEDVKQIRDTANKLEMDMKEMREAITVKIETFKQLHVQLCEEYKEHQDENIYEFLKTMFNKLEFPIPY